jgi:HEAT repeat protein
MGAARYFPSTVLKATISRVGILALLLAPPHLVHGQRGPALSELVKQFEGENVFWRQFEVAKAIVAENDPSVLPRLEPWLAHKDRSLRGNAAFIFSRLGDRRGFDVIAAILSDPSERREIHVISSVGLPNAQGQMRQDRYYAAHLLGDLKDARAIPVLVPLLMDPDVKYIVPWSLGQIGGQSAIPPLTGSLDDPDPSMRVLAIHALAELKASEALPRLRMLLDDHASSNFDKLESVANSAQGAIAALQPKIAR